MTARLTGREMLDEVHWLLDGGVHPLMVVQVLGKSAQAIEKAARTYGDRRIVAAFNWPAQDERQRRRRARTRQETAA